MQFYYTQVVYICWKFEIDPTNINGDKRPYIHFTTLISVHI